MLFMVKSAVCIGIVAALAASASGGGDARSALESGGRDAAASLGRACAASTNCIGLGTRIASAAIGQAGAVPDAVVHVGTERASDILAVTRAPLSSVLDAGRPPHLAERHIRRTVALKD